MAAYFLETSALVKRYVEEVGSAAVLALADPSRQHELLIASISEVELCSALWRKVRENLVAPEDARAVYRWFRHDCEVQYRIRVLDSAIMSTAIRLLEVYPLRAYDAIQLATCVECNGSRTPRDLVAAVFVSADVALVESARIEGLEVQVPGGP